MPGCGIQFPTILRTTIFDNSLRFPTSWGVRSRRSPKLVWGVRGWGDAPQQVGESRVTNSLGGSAGGEMPPNKLGSPESQTRWGGPQVGRCPQQVGESGDVGVPNSLGGVRRWGDAPQ